MLYRIQNGKYGQDSERELMNLKYNITVRVYDGFSNCWIVNQEADPQDDRMIMIIWDRISTHYDLLIPEGDNFDENRSRQLQNIFGRCSLNLQSLPLTNIHMHKSSLLVEPKINQNLKQQYDDDVDVEEVNYGSFFFRRSIQTRRERRLQLGSRLLY